MLFRSRISVKNLNSGRFDLFNKQFFRDLRDFKLRYEVTANGKIITTGDLKLPPVKPRKSVVITVPPKVLKTNDVAGDRFINFSLQLNVNTPWSHAGTEVAWAQFAFTSKTLPKPKAVKSKESFVSTDGEIALPYGVVAPRLTLWRAPTDNDRIGHIAEKWEKWGLRDLKRGPSTISRRANSTTVTTTWKTGSGISLKQIQIIEPVEGGCKVTEIVTLPKQLDDVARVGTNFELSGELDQLVYFGTGPAETMPDRKVGKIQIGRAHV